MSNTINLEFSVEEVDTILGALGNESYVKVSDLINKIRAQAVPQWQAIQEAKNPKPKEEDPE
jgi:hypothetical protein